MSACALVTYARTALIASVCSIELIAAGSDRRTKAAKRFLAKAVRRSRWTPRVINTDKNPAYGEAILSRRLMKLPLRITGWSSRS
jgi:transposase-like protein